MSEHVIDGVICIVRPDIWYVLSSDYRDGSQRKRFSIKKFAEKYNLEGPIAGNFMVAEYDDNVPAYHKHLNL